MSAPPSQPTGQLFFPNACDGYIANRIILPDYATTNY